MVQTDALVLQFSACGAQHADKERREGGHFFKVSLIAYGGIASKRKFVNLLVILFIKIY